MTQTEHDAVAQLRERVALEFYWSKEGLGRIPADVDRLRQVFRTYVPTEAWASAQVALLTRAVRCYDEIERAFADPADRTKMRRERGVTKVPRLRLAVQRARGAGR